MATSPDIVRLKAQGGLTQTTSGQNAGIIIPVYMRDSNGAPVGETYARNGTISNIATGTGSQNVTFSASHNNVVGTLVNIAGSNSTPNIDGTWRVTAVVSTNVLTLATGITVAVAGNTGTWKTQNTFLGSADVTIRYLHIGAGSAKSLTALTLSAGTRGTWAASGTDVGTWITVSTVTGAGHVNIPGEYQLCVSDNVVPSGVDAVMLFISSAANAPAGSGNNASVQQVIILDLAGDGQDTPFNFQSPFTELNKDASSFSEFDLFSLLAVLGAVGDGDGNAKIIDDGTTTSLVVYDPAGSGDFTTLLSYANADLAGEFTSGKAT